MVPAAIADYLGLTDGRVRTYLRGDKHVFVAYPQHAAEYVEGYEAGRLEERSHRPVFHVVFSFDPTVVQVREKANCPTNQFLQGLSVTGSPSG